MKTSKTIAFFDFDGTLTTKDSMFEFIKYCHGTLKLCLGLLWLSPYLVAYKVGLQNAQSSKQKILAFFFGGITELALAKKGEIFCDLYMDKILRKSGLERIVWHKRQEHQVVIVTASAGIWIKKLAQNLDIELISSELEVINGKITGLLVGKNCNGVEKVERIIKRYNLRYFNEIHAYGDSKNDLHMLSIATHEYYKFLK